MPTPKKIDALPKKLAMAVTRSYVGINHGYSKRPYPCYPNCTDQQTRNRILNIKRKSIRRMLLNRKSYLIKTLDKGKLKTPQYRLLKREFARINWPVPPHLNVIDYAEWILPNISREGL